MEIFKNNAILKNVLTVFIITLVIVVILYFINKYNKWKKHNPTIVNKVVVAKKLIKISSEKIPNSLEGTEFTYNFWMFINDWGYNNGKAKCVMYKGQKGGASTSPGIWLYPDTNKLMVRMACHKSNVTNEYLYPPQDVMTDMNPIRNPKILSTNSTQYVCDIPNIPLQRWVNVGVVLFNRTLDVYINGKLARSCILPGVPILNNEDLHITDLGGFGGYMSCVKVSSKALDPRKMYDMYEKGPNCSNLNSFLGNYKLEVKIGKQNDWEDAATASVSI